MPFNHLSSFSSAPARRFTGNPEEAVDNQPDVSASGVSRGQNQLHVLPEDWGAAASVIEPLLDRLDGSSPQTQLLIVTSNAESAAGVAHGIAAAAVDITNLGKAAGRR